MSSAAQTVRRAVRRLARTPTFSVTAILTLALGIGATAAVFSMVNAVLLRPLPYERSDRLVDLSHTLAIGGGMHVDQSDATFLLYRRDNHVFTDVGAYRSASVNLGDANRGGARGDIAPMRVPAVFASASVFRVLHAPARMGRALSEQDDDPASPPVAVLSWSLWQRAFAGDPHVMGRRISVDGVAREVVGVMPPEFHFPDASAALWIPLALDAANTKSAAFDYRGVARLRDGVTLATAQADLQRLLPRVPEVFPGRLTVGAIAATHMQAVVRPLRDVVVGDVGRVLWLVLGSVVVLLLVACANVANLFLARIESRQRELGVRRALGATPSAILIELEAESAAIAFAGAALGLAIAGIGVALIKRAGDAVAIPRLVEVRVDPLVTAVALGLAALAALIVSALPLVRLNRMSLVSILGSGDRSATAGRGRHRARRALVIAQIALALLLLTVAGLFTRSFARLRAVNPGFGAANAVTFRMSIPPVLAPTTTDVAQVVTRVTEAVSTLSGVSAAGAVTKLPLDPEARQDSAVFMEDHPLQPGEIPPIRQIAFATPTYFSAMSIPVIAGRLFAPLDPRGVPANGPPEVVVTRSLAMRYWGISGAIGKRVRMTATDPWHVIVGVVGDVHDEGLDQPPAEMVYCPMVTANAAGAPWMPRNLAFVVRSRSDDAALTNAIRQAIATTTPSIPTYRMMPLGDLVADATARAWFTLLLVVIAGIAATSVGAVGIYGVISYLVTLRTREIGVRMALGADARAVRRHVSGQAIRDAAVGVVLGLIGSVVATRSLQSLLFDVQPTDPLTLVTVSALLVATAFAASWLPARRAAALDPAIALRHD